MTVSQDDKLEKEHGKLLSRKEELTKQETSLRREYATLLRKIASLHTVLKNLEDIDDVSSRTLSPEALEKVPQLKRYMDLVQELDAEDTGAIQIPDYLLESYNLYKCSPLLYKDVE